MFTAKDFMSSPVISTTADAAVKVAVRRMRQHGISSMLVEPSSAEQPYGIITKRDVVSKVVAVGREPSEVTVAEVMSAPVVSIPPSYSLQECSVLMASAGFRRLPVFVDGRPVGILSDTDIFAAVEEAGWGPTSDQESRRRQEARARIAAKLTGKVPFPEALAESILAELET